MKILRVCLSASLLFISWRALVAEVFAESTFKIGLSLPLSGDLSAIGKAFQNGVELARKELPQRFKRLEFIYDDNRYEAKAAIASFEKLGQQPGDIIFMWGSPACMAVAPLAERAARPLVCFSGDPKPTLNFVFSFNDPASDYAHVMAQYIAQKNIKRLALISTDIPFYTNLANELVRELPPNSFVMRESLSPTEQDFGALVTKLKFHAPEGLVAFILPPQLPAFSKRMATLNFKPHIIGADTFADLGSVAESHGALNNAVYVDMAVDSEFSTKYASTYGSTTNLTFAYNGYQFALMVGSLLEKQAQHRPSAEIIKLLRSYRGSASDRAEQIEFRRTEAFGQYFYFPIELKKINSQKNY